MDIVSPPQVLMFPFPYQGHVSPMLRMAELISISGIHVTFLTTENVHGRLLRHGGAAVQNRPGFVFRTFSDGLPDDHPRSVDTMGDAVLSIPSTAQPSVKQILSSGNVTCIISDILFGHFMIDLGHEFEIPVILFHVGSASYAWACFSIPDIIQSGELPIKGNENKDREIKSVAGMESFLRCRDFPSMGTLMDTDEGVLETMSKEIRQSSRAKAVILNTFEDLEGPIVSNFRAHCNPKVYTIGPLHAHPLSTGSDHNNSLFQVDKSYIAWLDSQPSKSVVYVSFGSLTIMSKEQLMEFWHGLVNSKKRFLWAIRPNLLLDGGGEGLVLRELSEGTRERGFIAGWVPQEEVLSHRSVGGFLTHSGWNSTLESIVAGVPMMCWPFFGDHPIISRYVGEVWKLGIDMKDNVCDRKFVEKTVNDVMVERRGEFERSTAEMASLAKRSVSQGGSSNCNFNTLIEDIKMMRK